MAVIKPSTDVGSAKGVGRYRELAVLKDLAKGLPDNVEIFHSVFIHNSDGESDSHCEIDVVVMGADGRLLLMEIKAGDVYGREGLLYKTYDNHEHDIDRQCQNQYMAMVRRLKDVGLRTDLTRCLVLPDHVLGQDQAVSMPRVRIIDAHGYKDLDVRVRAMLESAPSGRPMSSVEDIRAFLDNHFQISPDLAVMGRQLRDATTVLADGLASWVPRISVPSRVVRVQATAGSGKTQLALRLVADAVVAGKSVLYVCFNRPLADHMAMLVSPRATVASFHELSMAHFRRHCGEPDFSRSSAFTEAADVYVQSSASFTARYDVLLIDEAQDFDHHWLGALFALLHEGGALYLLEDEQQQLYGREPFDIAEAVLVRSMDNFRSPRAICQSINAFGLTKEAVVSRSPYAGHLPSIFSYADAGQLLVQTEAAVFRLLQQGFRAEDIVLLSAHGRQRSVLTEPAVLAGCPVRRFTGQYDRDGNACWSEGQLMVDSIYRFKGQSARAVVLTELDFHDMTAREQALLFVGMTRATMALSIVLASHTEALLMQRLDAGSISL